MSKTPPELMPFDEVCGRLGIGESTLYRGLKAGNVPGGRRLGNRWIIARAVFERWLVEGIEPGDQPVRTPFLKTVSFGDRTAS